MLFVSAGYKEESVPCLLQILKVVTFLGSWPIPPLSEPTKYLCVRVLQTNGTNEICIGK